MKLGFTRITALAISASLLVQPWSASSGSKLPAQRSPMLYEQQAIVGSLSFVHERIRGNGTWAPRHKAAELSAKRRTAPRDIHLMTNGSLIVNITNGMHLFAQASLMAALTNHSAFYLALDSSATALALLIFLPLSSYVTERAGKRFFLGIQMVRPITSLLILVLLWLHALEPWHLISLSFLTGIGQAFSFPLYQMMLGTIARDDREKNLANSMLDVRVAAAQVIGPLLGATVARFGGLAACFSANILGFSLFVLSIFLVRTDLSASSAPRIKKQELRDYLRKNRAFYLLFFILGLSTALGFPLFSLLPAVFVRGGFELGFSQALFGSGSIVAAWIWRHVHPESQIRFSISAMWLWGSALLGFSMGPHFFLFFCVAAAGFASGWIRTSIRGILQVKVPRVFSARIWGIYFGWFYGGLFVGNALVSFLSKGNSPFLDPYQTLYTFGGLMLLSAIAIARFAPEIKAPVFREIQVSSSA